MAATSRERRLRRGCARELKRGAKPPPMLTVPLPPRKARTAWRAGLGRDRARCDSSTRAATGSVRPRVPHRPPWSATQEMRSSTSADGQLGVAADGRRRRAAPGAPPGAARRARAAASMIARRAGCAVPARRRRRARHRRCRRRRARSRPSQAIDSDRRPSAIAAGPPWMSTNTVGRPRNAAIRASAKYISRPRARVSGPARAGRPGRAPTRPRSRRRGAGRARDRSVGAPR